MISRLLLSLLLITAALLHFFVPQAFDPAIPFSFKREANCFAGIVEFFLGMGLWHPRLKDTCARLSALWFIALIPIHLYVSIQGIPIFGVTHPLALWGRTVLQPALFFWALSLQEKGWIISQRWSEVLFLHYEVDAQELQKKVPYPIDLFDGKAVVSIVPFMMSRIRFPFLPAIPGFSKLYELNLRTYVKIHGKSAVYFFTLDSNHLPGVLVARWFFSLPYRLRKMHLNHTENYSFKSELFTVQANVEEGLSTSAFDLWATERYALVTKRWGSDLWGVVEHKKWPLQKVHIQSIDDRFSQEFLVLKKFMGASFAKTLDVRFRPFVTLSK